MSCLFSLITTSFNYMLMATTQDPYTWEAADDPTWEANELIMKKRSKINQEEKQDDGDKDNSTSTCDETTTCYYQDDDTHASTEPEHPVIDAAKPPTSSPIIVQPAKRQRFLAAAAAVGRGGRRGMLTRAASQGQEKLRQCMWSETLQEFRKREAPSTNGRMVIPKAPGLLLGSHDDQDNTTVTTPKVAAATHGYRVDSSCPDLGYGDSSSSSSSSPPTSSDLGYGDEPSPSDLGYGDEPSPSDLGYGDEPSPSDLGYGCDANPPTRPDHDDDLGYHSDHIPLEKQRGIRRRCSVTKFSLQASAKAQAELAKLAQSNKRNFLFRQNSMKSACDMTESEDDDDDDEDYTDSSSFVDDSSVDYEDYDSEELEEDEEENNNNTNEIAIVRMPVAA